MSYVMEAKMMKKIHQMNMPSPIELSRYKEEMDAGKIIDDLINKCNKNPSNNDIRETLIPFLRISNLMKMPPHRNDFYITNFGNDRKIFLLLFFGKFLDGFIIQIISILIIEMK